MIYPFSFIAGVPFLLSLTVVHLEILQVSAHGYVHQVTIDGRTYPGNPPSDVVGGAANQISPSIIRQITDQGPVKGASNKDLNCGMGNGNNGGKGAKLVADAMPGSIFVFDWTTADNGSWPHNTGPIMTYMTNCGSVSCDQYDPTNAGWFKIAESGKDTDSTWYQAQIMKKGNWQVTLPVTLAAGNYIIRHEIIALHLAVSQGGAEFYPSCTQITVGGNQNGAPDASELVTFPGAYSDDDPGIYDPDVYNNDDPYNESKMPGPPVAKFVGTTSSGSSPPSSTSGSGSSPSTTTSASTTSTASHSPVQSCGLRRKASVTGTTVTPTASISRRHRRQQLGVWDTVKLSLSAFH